MVKSRDKRMVKTSVELRKDLMDRFIEIYPGMSFKAFFNGCLEEFCQLHDPEVIKKETKEAVERSLLSLTGGYKNGSDEAGESVEEVNDQSGGESDEELLTD